MGGTDSVRFLRKQIDGVEHRQDPLFGSWTRINPDRATRPKHTGGASRDKDLIRLIETSRAACPFCPETREGVTPVFPPSLFGKERLRQGQSVLFPNKNPFGQHHAVGILTDAHFVPMPSYSEEVLLDSLLLSGTYFRALHRKDPSLRFPVYVWNFLPPSAGSIVHPHVQLLLETGPAPIIKTLTDRCETWRNEHDEEYWNRLLQEESKGGERLIHCGQDVAVLASFAPRGFNETLIIVRGSGALGELTEAQSQAFMGTLVKLLRAYDAMGVGSFNLVTYSPPLGVHPPPFPFHAKLISRPYPSGIYSNDTGFFERMYDLWIIDTLPEALAAQVRIHFDTPTSTTP